jgi:hypothetical protein
MPLIKKILKVKENNHINRRIYNGKNTSSSCPVMLLPGRAIRISHKEF